MRWLSHPCVWVLAAFVALQVVLYVVARIQRRQGARDALRVQKRLYSEEHDYRLVSPEEFPELDHAWYAWITETLGALGFAHLADIENLTVKEAMPNARAFIRVLLGGEGTVMAGAYDVKLRGFMGFCQSVGLLPRDLRTLDLETELSDGTFVATSNALGADKSADTPGIHRTQVHRYTAPAQMLDGHLYTVRVLMEQRPGVEPVRMHTFEAMMESQKREQRLKHEHKAGIGYVDREEIRRMGGPGKERLADQLASDMEKATRKEGKE